MSLVSVATSSKCCHILFELIKVSRHHVYSMLQNCIMNFVMHDFFLLNTSCCRRNIGKFDAFHVVTVRDAVYRRRLPGQERMKGSKGRGKAYAAFDLPLVNGPGNL